MVAPDSVTNRPTTSAFCVLLAAVGVCLCGGQARAIDLPAAGGLDATGDAKRLYIEFGAYLGSDSNVTRKPAGSELGDTALELIGGLVVSAGNERSKFGLRAHVRSDMYSEHDTYNNTEANLLAGARYDSGRIVLVLDGEYAMLADPVDIQATALMARSRVTLSPGVDFEFGQLELGLGYSLKSTDYDAATFDYLDSDDSLLKVEFRWGRRDLEQLFVRFDSGAMDYAENAVRDDFDYGGTYLGWRAEMPRFALELAVGTNSVDGSGFSGSEVAGYARTTLLLGETKSILFGVSKGMEAASAASYKSATRLFASYRQTVSSRWNWSLGLASESSDFVDPDDVLLTSLDHLAVNGGIQVELGSPGGAHGRFFLTFSHETRSGHTATDYGRTRVLLGVAFVR